MEKERIEESPVPQAEDDYHRTQRLRIEKVEREVDILKKALAFIEGKPKLGRPTKDKDL